MVKHFFLLALLSLNSLFVFSCRANTLVTEFVVPSEEINQSDKKSNEDRIKATLELLDLSNPKLHKVKKSYDKGKYNQAAKALLSYYRNNLSFQHPSFTLDKVTVSDKDREYASKGMQHIFYSVKGREPENYGKDIDWTYWPTKDNEVRWQLHRMFWWQPMGRVYYTTKNEEYAQEWVYQYLDWIKKNPMPQDEKSNEKRPNSHYAWRPLEVSHRIQDQIIQFQLFLGSKHFTEDFLMDFIANYYRQVEHIINNFTKEGNHLLFQAQRVLSAGVCFPEIKRAKEWRSIGIEKLNGEIKKQVFEDGGHFELDISYHIASINIFITAYQLAEMNGYGLEFPNEYLDIVKQMIVFVENVSYPNNTTPIFGDTRFLSSKVMLNNYKNWSKLFPKDHELKYFASNKKSGSEPNYLSKSFPTTGYYIFRNSWKENGMQMVLKATGKGGWHNQPDTGTFELLIKGRNFFPDSGCYLYSGDAKINKEREWFRQTKVHNTMTLNEVNAHSEPELLKWSVDNSKKSTDILSYINSSYGKDGKNILNHKRSVFFVEKEFFIILDEAIGNATGEVEIHYNFVESNDGNKVTSPNFEQKIITTTFNDGNDIFLKVFSTHDVILKASEGRVSYEYNKFKERDRYSYSVNKKDDNTVRFVSIIYPVSNSNMMKEVYIEGLDTDTIKLNVNNKAYTLQIP